MFTFTPQQLAAYRADGYVLARGLFDSEEIQTLLEFARHDEQFRSSVYGRKDAAGQETKLALWNKAGDDLYSLFARDPRLIDPSAQTLGDEIYLYHMKMMLKEPRVGGAWEWHQDYGYWYNYGCLYPDLISCLIAVTGADRENGCLQVLKGSHLLGRVDHNKAGEQVGADPERVGAAMERMELVYVETQPGDTLFFHCNLLHRSDQNNSDRARWSLICCYNTKRNSPYKSSRHPSYSPLAKTAPSAIKQWRAKAPAQAT